MDPVETLVVMATNRGRDLVLDQLDALRWSCLRPFHVVVVDDAGTAGPEGDHGDHSIVRSRVDAQKRMSGFKNNEGIRHALEVGLDFRAVMLLDDDSLPIGRGLDAWGLHVLDAEAADLVGVADRANYTAHWPRWRERFAAWAIEADGFLPHPRTIFYATSWISREFADELADRDLLVPDGYAAWDLWPDVYVSWMAQVLGFHTLDWGTMDVAAAPLYLNHPDYMVGAPQPWNLRADFLVYHSTRSVPGVSEAAIRSTYAARRRAAGVA